MNKQRIINWLITLVVISSIITLLEISKFLETIFSNDFQSGVKMFSSRVNPTYIYVAAWTIFALFFVKWVAVLLMLFRQWWGYWIYVLLNFLALAFVLLIVITFKVMNYQPWLIIALILVMGTGYTIIYANRKLLKESTEQGN